MDRATGGEAGGLVDQDDPGGAGETLIADFEIDYDPYLTSQNKLDGYHFRSANKVKGLCRDAAQFCWKAAGRPGEDNLRRIRVEITLYRGAALDVLNLAGGMKSIYDALFRRSKNEEGIVPDDNRKWIPGAPIINQVIAPCWKGAEKVRLRVFAFGEPLKWKPRAPKVTRLEGQAALDALAKHNRQANRAMRAPDWRTRRSFGRRRF